MEKHYKTLIIPAVIAATPEELEAMLQKIGGHAPLVQLDVMDGAFVPSTSLHFPLRLQSDPSRFEAHLMIQDPQAWIEENGDKVGTIIPHFEALADAKALLRRIKGMDRKAGLAINPDTPLDKILSCLEMLDEVLVMTVNPGFYGSPFLPDTLDKVRRLRKIRPDLNIEVDGGIKPETIGLAQEAGANLFVSGSYIVRSENVQERIAILRSKIL